jgi:starch-binding outer membrane protein, SusD/RagB family
MKKNYKKVIYLPIVVILTLFTVFGCSDDFFDVKAGDRITPDQHYNSFVDANVSLQGAIIYLQDYMPNLILMDGLRSDAMDVTPNADQYLDEINNHIFTKENPYTNPSELYKVIINVNEVLLNIDNIGENDKDYNELIAYQVKGALIGLRAWTYLTLVRLYNQAAYFETNMVSIPENLSQLILSKEVIINLLIEQLLPYIHDNSSGPQMLELRIPHYMNTKALLGELYLEAGNYANAVKYLKLACESYLDQPAMLKVDRTYRDAAWSTIFFNAESNTLENISVIPFSRAQDQFNPLATLMGYNFRYMVRPTQTLVDSFMEQIPLAGAPGDLWRGKGITFNADTTAWINDSTFVTQPYITKYAIDQNDPFSSDIIISRAADIHLLLAEAYNRMGDPTSQAYALMLLNDGVNAKNPKPAQFTRWSNNLGIRGRVYLKSKVIPEDLPAESVLLLIEDYIMAERAMELAFEGKRWFDLVRIAERRNDPGYLADKVAAKFAGTAKYNEIHAKLMNPANWYLPFK